MWMNHADHFQFSAAEARTVVKRQAVTPLNPPDFDGGGYMVFGFSLPSLAEFQEAEF